jgi:hypothetical protein
MSGREIRELKTQNEGLLEMVSFFFDIFIQSLLRLSHNCNQSGLRDGFENHPAFLFGLVHRPDTKNLPFSRACNQKEKVTGCGIE